MLGACNGSALILSTALLFTACNSSTERASPEGLAPSASGATPAAALPTVTTTPARLLGLDDRLGRVAPNYDADLVLLSPDLRVVETFVGGESVYRG